MKYEEIEVGDIVCAKTVFGDLDIKTLGQVIEKLEKSSYDEMKVICVSHYYNVQNVANFGDYAPKELSKLDVQILYKIMNTQKSFSHFSNLAIRRR